LIKVSKGESLDRYYLFKLFGFGLFLHRIHASDPMGTWHNHPWSGISFILGSYGEEVMTPGPETPFVKANPTYFKVRYLLNYIPAKRYHRVLVLKPTWTLFFHFRKSNKWSAIDANGRRVETPWEGEGTGRSYRAALDARPEGTVVSLDVKIKVPLLPDDRSYFEKHGIPENYSVEDALSGIPMRAPKCPPITLLPNGKIADGNARYDAYVACGQTTIPARYIGTEEIVDVEISKIRKHI
jgi:hypothetical protein